MRKAARAMEFDPRSVSSLNISEWNNGSVRCLSDTLAGEEPLEIRAGNRPLSVTMRTPGDDLELAAGFLFTEGIIQSADEIVSVCLGEESAPRQNIVRLELRQGLLPDAKRIKRNFLSTSSCGLCGKASLKAIRAQGIHPPNPDFRIDPEILCSLPATLKSSQILFGRTGGLHAAALFDAAGKLIVLKEDVGRHNAVDKLIGWALLERRIPLSDYVMLASGRGGFEIIQKSLQAGIPLLASVSAASSLAVQLAREFGQTLVGFLREKRFVIYTGEERLGLLSSSAREWQSKEIDP